MNVLEEVAGAARHLARNVATILENPESEGQGRLMQFLRELDSAVGELLLQDTETSDPVERELLLFQQFALWPEQVEVVEEALTAAQAISGSDRRGHNLTLVCMDYLATNGAALPGEQAFREYLATLERLFHVRLIAVDPTTRPHDLLYGMTSLEDLFRSRGINVGDDDD